MGQSFKMANADLIRSLQGHSSSSIQMERQYLLSTLAEEERRTESLAKELENTRIQIRKLDPNGPSKTLRDLNRTAAGLQRRLKSSRKREAAMVNNLAALTSSLQSLDANKWRRAEVRHQQRMQAEQLGLADPIQMLANKLQGVNLADYPTATAPATPLVYPYTSSFPSPGFLPPTPASPFLLHDAYGTPLYSPAYEAFPDQSPYPQHHFGRDQQYDLANLPQLDMTWAWGDYSMAGQQQRYQPPSLAPADDRLSPSSAPRLFQIPAHPRTMSLPVAEGRKPSIWTIDEEEKEKLNMTRRGTVVLPGQRYSA